MEQEINEKARMERTINKRHVVNRIVKLINESDSRIEVDEYLEILVEILKYPEFWFRRIFIHRYLENLDKYDINKIRKI